EKNCVGCHNQKLRMAGLSLVSAESALRGGKRGPAITPKDPDSLLLQAVRQQGNLRMPPARTLTTAEIATLDEWIRNGAIWPQDSVSDSAQARPNHWSFLAPKPTPPPPVRQTAWVRTPIDQFILARLEKEKIPPSPPAARETLVRRLYLDLLGLPPAVSEVREYLDDQRPDAWERLVDKLLASPHYGERWARRWLDYARYADSDGGSRDEPRQIWRYRDWVIDALNRDMPFDEFVIDQLAGDLRPNPTEAQLIATGFHRNSPIQIEAGTDREQYRTEAVFDRTDVTGTVFLGLSVGCAKCHDHKFDPVSQKEYYRLFAFFNSSDDWGNDRPLFSVALNNLEDVQGPFLYFGPAEEVRRRRELAARLLELDREASRLSNTVEGQGKYAKTPEVNQLVEEMKRLRAALPNLPSTMIMRELDKPRPTHILKSGEYLAKGEAVTPGTPSFLPAFAGPEIGANRLHLAQWLVDKKNPLFARVTVNRIWQEYFGRGLVPTENDFGTQGSPPTHPELLDWLALEFQRAGWSQKAMHRLIVNSAAYRQSSALRPDLSEKDPLNFLLARQTRLRLDAEIVRDVALRASGLLVPQIGGPSAFPPQPEAAMSASQVKKVWIPSEGPDRYRRGMYTFFWRLTPHPSLIVFDAPSSVTACSRRTRSNTPLQALALLNESAFHEFAQALGKRIVAEGGATEAARLRHGFELVLARLPSPAELARLQSLARAERDALLTKPEHAKLLAPGAGLEQAVMTAVARALLNLDEAITRE
ncbi:MAG: hypothetical protein B7Z47_05285, partial [Chthoniobacter sp. 12-60-6]